LDVRVRAKEGRREIEERNMRGVIKTELIPFYPGQSQIVGAEYAGGDGDTLTVMREGRGEDGGSASKPIGLLVAHHP
jgi:hypothetical protein